MTKPVSANRSRSRGRSRPRRHANLAPPSPNSVSRRCRETSSRSPRSVPRAPSESRRQANARTSFRRIPSWRRSARQERSSTSPAASVSRKRPPRFPPAEPTNLPEAGQEPPPVEHTISLTKRTCPEGTDREIGHGALLAACPVTSDVEFTRTFGGGATSTTSTNSAAVASWTGIPYGEFEIQETNFADYTQQTAFRHVDRKR